MNRDPKHSFLPPLFKKTQTHPSASFKGESEKKKVGFLFPSKSLFQFPSELTFISILNHPKKKAGKRRKPINTNNVNRIFFLSDLLSFSIIWLQKMTNVHTKRKTQHNQQKQGRRRKKRMYKKKQNVLYIHTTLIIASLIIILTTLLFH